MAVKETLVPLLPVPLRDLQLYLVRRDAGVPNVGLAGLPLEQEAIGVLQLDRIAWDYSPPQGIARGPERRDPDGFIVWWANELTGSPADGGLRVSFATRAFSMAWPPNVVRSYAVQTFRNTYQGEELGELVQHSTWAGVAGTLGDGACEALCVKQAFHATGTLAGASYTATNFIEAGWALWGIRATVLTAITGATGFDVGLSSVPTLWGSNLSPALTGTFASGQGNWVGRSLPQLYPVADSPLLTAQGGAFTGGAVRLTAFYTDDWL